MLTLKTSKSVKEKLKEGIFIARFYWSNKKSFTTTLGRRVQIIQLQFLPALNAEMVTIWKDVRGY